MTRWILIIGLMLCSTAAAKKRSAALLVSVHSPTGVNFWWQCAGEPTSSLVEGIAQTLSQANINLVRSCENREKTVHKSYRHPNLKPHEVINLSSALDTDLGISGKVIFKQQVGVPQLGLVHYSASLSLMVHDPKTDSVIGRLEVTSNGYHNKPAKAIALAENLLRAKLTTNARSLFKTTPKPQPKAKKSVLIVEAKQVLRQGDMDLLVRSLRALPKVQSVMLSEVTVTGAVIHIKPISARQPVQVHLATLPFQAQIVN